MGGGYFDTCRSRHRRRIRFGLRLGQDGYWLPIGGVAQATMLLADTPATCGASLKTLSANRTVANRTCFDLMAAQLAIDPFAVHTLRGQAILVD